MISHMSTDQKALTMFNMCIPCSSFKTHREYHKSKENK